MMKTRVQTEAERCFDESKVGSSLIKFCASANAPTRTSCIFKYTQCVPGIEIRIGAKLNLTARIVNSVTMHGTNPGTNRAFVSARRRRLEIPAVGCFKWRAPVPG
jgi:hypothetical protein